MSNRKSGVLMHVSSLPGSFSVGSFGAEARLFIDKLCEGGFSLWQVLPLCMTDEYNSPYKSLSAFAGNPYFIDLITLYQKGLLTEGELLSARQRTPYACEFDRLADEREALLRVAASRVRDRSEILNFLKSRPELSVAVKYLATREKNGGATHHTWTTDEYEFESYFYHAFVQYEFFTQWHTLKEYANARGVKIIGDIPIYVAEDGCEVWAEPEQFRLDAKGFPTDVAGVPPDYFSANGQMWGNPLYNYEEMAKDGFSWWRRRIRFALSMFDGVRIDHFRGFEAYWSIPVGASSAKEGKWVKGPGEALIDAIREEAGDRLVIAEDLGDITDAVRELLDYSGFPGMRVLQFGFISDDNSLHLPHNYPKNTVAYTGTHDNNTLLGYIWELPEETRERVLEYCGADGKTWERGCEAAIRTVLQSHADTAIIPVQDLLVYGADTRMNTPGTSGKNWAYRIRAEQLESLPTEKLLRLNKLCGRRVD